MPLMRRLVFRGTTQPTGDYPNEPVGYTRFLEHRLQAIPNGTNGEAGTWYNWSTSDITIIADATEPAPYNNSVLRTRFPVGLQEGYAPGCAWGAGFTQKREIYARFTLYLETGFVCPPGSHMTKILGFIGYSDTGGANNEGILGMTGSPAAPFDFQLRQQGQASGAVNQYQNVDATNYLTTGAWHKIEIQCVLNDIGSANGIWRAWINGVKVSDASNITYRNNTYPAGFHVYEFIPYWGGSSANTIQVEQYCRVGSVYFSGVDL
jgi:hypothetical protein